MAPFPDYLPPSGLDPVTKILIYGGIFYVILTAITTWLITRRRSFPKAVRVKEPTPTETRTSPVSEQMVRGITEALSFDDTKDNLASLKIEIQGAETALAQLQELKGDLSSEAYNKLSAEYNSRVGELTTMMNDMLKSNIETSTGQVDEGISDDEMEAIEADLEKQLMDLDNDDFLNSRPKRSMDEIFQDTNSQEAPQTSTPVSSTPATSPDAEKKRVPMPPPPSKNNTPASSTPATPAAQASSATATPPDAEKKRVPMPPPPSKKSAVAPPPPKSSGSTTPKSSGSTTPKASPPSAQPPKTNQPLSAAQPMKVQAEDDDGMFAKSTSIAALRMDMLRELARLKKLIPEDQEKDQ